MAFTDYEETVELGQSVQLFLFRYGSDPSEYYAYTDATLDKPDDVLTVASIDYIPRPIERAAIASNGTLDKSALKITTDIGSEVAELFRVYPPSHVVTLVIAQGHIGDPDSEWLVIWAGRVMKASREGNSEFVMTGEPVSTSLKRPGLRRNFQFGCMHDLYGPQCQADKPSATVSSTVAVISGNLVTLTAGWEGAFAPDKFLGGLLEWPAPGGSTESRTIIRIAGDVLTLSGITRDLAVTDAVDVVLGCNHKAYAADGGDCQPLHNNILNYGGCLWIPLQNPIGTFNNYW
jgi:hypothetical protein